ncbi:S1C family serine protease [Plantactinospora sonchi]|uniref:Trypsin-like peptidase domain-containing protein n=1 Tax=Plantactinospora sonchi TaxID=1544735 RepID=A0ABU7RKZ4_9ACTN
MSEFETDPQRRPADADRELSHPTAELPRDDRGQTAELPRDDRAQTAELPRDDRGQSDAGAATPGTSSAATDSGSTAQAPPAAGTVPGTPYGGTTPAYGATTPASGQPYGTSAPASGPAYGGVTPASGQPYGPGPYGAAPASGQPYTLPPTGQPASPWQAPHGAPQHQHPGWAGHHPTGHPGPHGPGGGMPPHQPYGGPVPPPWGPPGGTNPTPGRLGKLVAVGATALALMVGSGLAGGAIALALDDSGGVTKTYSAAPVINSADLPKIAAQVQNSVVSISTSNAEGSGVVMSADGYVLTNNHVVASATGNQVQVFFADGTKATAEIVGTDPKTDLAVIKAQGVSGLSAAKFGDSDAMQVGDTVLALGSPLGLQGSVTAGIISARERTIQAGGDEQGSPFERPQQGGGSISGLLQTDAPINPGNSGGALINTNAEVIGINTAIATAGQGTGNIGVGFAIPSNKAKAVAEALQRGEKVSHPSLGVSVNTAENGGALVGGVVAGSAADKAGIQQGDVITQFGDKKINDSNDLVAAVQAGKVGDQVQVTYTRNGAQTTATVTLTETS